MILVVGDFECGEMPDPGTSGIYAIRNTRTGEAYIGGSGCIYSRIYGHVWYLIRGEHRNRKLQEAWRKHGPSAFVYEVLEIVPEPGDLLEREQYWLHELKAVMHGYNLSPTAGNNSGVVIAESGRANIAGATRRVMADPMARKRTSEATRRGMADPEVRRKCSESAKKRWLLDGGFRAKAHAPKVDRKRKRVYPPRGDKEQAAQMKRAKMQQHWQSMTPEERQKRCDRLRQNWQTMSAERRESRSAVSGRKYKVTSPDGSQEQILNLGLFCRSHGLAPKAAYYCAAGKQEDVKGYRFERVQEQ